MPPEPVPQRSKGIIAMSLLHIRPARRSDCVDIARLVVMSSDGIAEYIWGPYVGGRTSLIAVGTRRSARDGVPFSYQNCLIAEVGSRIAGSLHAVAVPAPFEQDRANDPDPVLRQLLDFSDLGSLEIRGLAVYPAFRGQGAATMLMSAAAEQARSRGLRRLSVVCFVANAAAIHFYRKFGFTVVNRAPSPAHPAFRHTGGEMLLLARPATLADTGERLRRDDAVEDEGATDSGDAATLDAAAYRAEIALCPALAP
ncbi:MAG: GNAT family N-acetyltransferase [Dongiaceae bacterium]